MKKRVLAMLLMAVMLVGVFCGCGKEVSGYLAEANYAEAYDTAETKEEKALVKAENTFAHLSEKCKTDVFGGEDVEFNLQAAWCIDGEKLSDALVGYKYYLLKIGIDTQSGYVLYNYSTEDKAWNNMLNALSLEEESTDDNAVSFKKIICNGIISSKESYELGSESLYRINTLITNDSLKNIKLSDDHRF
ncbi:MAG: hypothetical protein J6S13_00245 [Clostridia bacterium]|nr:hypothetical protein [Clostridia bacterium]